MSEPRIKRVAIVGGTHGNELTGIYLVKKFQRLPALIQRATFESIPILANPVAFSAVRRYVHADLNRCFTPEILEQPRVDTYEAGRARELYETLVVNQASRVDLILDIHSTTANMGLTVILVNHHPFNLKLTAYLTRMNPAVKVYSAYQPGKSLTFLNAVCELGFAIEVGAIAQGTLQAQLFQQTETLIHAILDYCDRHNQGNGADETQLTVYQHVQTVDYPQNDQGELIGMIHPHLQHQDYKPLSPGDPIFLTWEGETLRYEGATVVYPIFINEAAYYEKGIACCLTERQTLAIAAT